MKMIHDTAVRTVDNLLEATMYQDNKHRELGPNTNFVQRVGSCYLELSFGTTGVDTWCYLECYLVLPGVSPGVTWCYLGVTWYFLYFLMFSFVVPK